MHKENTTRVALPGHDQGPVVRMACHNKLHFVVHTRKTQTCVALPGHDQGPVVRMACHNKLHFVVHTRKAQTCVALPGHDQGPVVKMGCVPSVKIVERCVQVGCNVDLVVWDGLSACIKHLITDECQTLC